MGCVCWIPIRAAAVLMVPVLFPQLSCASVSFPYPVLAHPPREMSAALSESLAGVDAFLLYQFFLLLHHLEMSNGAIGERLKSYLVSSP